MSSYNPFSVAGASVDVVQASDLGIGTSDTLVLTFAFVPTEIIVQYSMRTEHDTSNEIGHTTGQSIVTITGTDTMTVNLNYTTVFDANGAIDVAIGQNDTTNTTYGCGGNDGVDDATVAGVGTWDTSSKQLTITFTTNNSDTSENFIEIIASAYM